MTDACEEDEEMRPGESKRDRFKRLAQARTNRIISTLRLLGNCSSKSNYEYTDEDVRKIFSVIERELKAARNRFTGASKQKDDLFTLD